MATTGSGVEMADDEVAQFLTEQGDGVLSFGGTPVYSLPVSFAYDARDVRVVFQFLFAPHSEKRTRIERDDEVRLVTYDWTAPDDWRSAILTGRLSPVKDGPAQIAAAEVFADYATPISMSVLDAPAEELDPQWYEFDIHTMRGRRSPLRDD